MEDRKIFIRNAFRAALDAGLIESQQDFANKVGINAASLSKALKGIPEYTTKGICARIKAAFPELDVDGNLATALPLATPSPPQASDVVTLSNNFIELLKEKDKQDETNKLWRLAVIMPVNRGVEVVNFVRKIHKTPLSSALIPLIYIEVMERAVFVSAVPK